MLSGLLVDLVPHGKQFMELEHKWQNNESRFWGSGGDRYFISKAVIEARHQRWAEMRERRPSTGVPFGIQTKDGVPIGYFGINWVDTLHRLGMLGAVIGEPAYWDGGYGTDALLLVVEYAFNWLDLRKVWLLTTSMNARVIRQMEKVGFTLEACRREGAYGDGVWYDWLIYGLLREEWPGRDVMIETLGLRAPDAAD